MVVAAFTLGLSLPLLLARGGVAGGLPTFALIMATQAIGDGLTNLITVTWRVRDAWRFLFLGYILRGLGLAAIGAAALLASPWLAPIGMAAGSFVLGGVGAALALAGVWGARRGPAA